MRRRIDMTEVEAATKIRAKYLRALENEEWDLLPGPTFVKTFLRTYAEYLELDPKILVEEYRQRFERPSTQDLTPFGPGMGGARRRRQRPAAPDRAVRRPALRRRRAGRRPVPAGRVGRAAGEGGAEHRRHSHADGDRDRHAAQELLARKKKKARRRACRCGWPRPIRVFMCLVDATGRQVLDGVQLEAGKRTKAYRSKRFRANFGNGSVRMTVNGKRYRAEDIGRPIGYEFRPGKKPKRLSEKVRVGLCA